MGVTPWRLAFCSTRPPCRPTAEGSAGTSTGCCAPCTRRARTSPSCASGRTSNGTGSSSPGRASSRARRRCRTAPAAADVLHLPTYTVPTSTDLPTVVTIHDVTLFAEPEPHDPVRTTYVKSATRTAARRATRIIAPSRATRDELVRVLGADPDRIDVAYHGVDQRAF